MSGSLAVKLAYNISRFLTFGFQFSSALITLDKSPPSASHVIQECDNLATTINEYQLDLHFKLAENVTLGSEEDQICFDISQHCQRILSQLATAVASFKAQKCEGDVSDINISSLENLSIREELDVIKKDLKKNLAPILWSNVNETIRDLAAGNSRLEASRSNDIQALTSALNPLFESLKGDNLDDGSNEVKWFEIVESFDEAAKYSTEQVILGALHFWTMNRRQELISKEHVNTFEWIFAQDQGKATTQPAVNFTEWLVNDEPLYWISGKPGSGKSTVVKFVAENARTMEKLQRWAGQDRLVTASFYFWSSAKDSLQKSDAGLLRSILFQILRRCPDLIERAFPEQWEACLAHGSQQQLAYTVSNTTELLGAYMRVSNLLSSVGVKFCFFIDGLDEYEGNPVNIVRLIESLSQTPNLKACISSRPWTEFESSFGGKNPWKLYVHELTGPDMIAYIEDLLQLDPTFRRLREVEGEAEVKSLVDNIVQRAQGVFLWVFLVARFLIDGLAESDRISDLNTRLSLLPTDLELYFEQILLSIDDTLRQQTAHTFLMTLHAAEKLPLLCYASAHGVNINTIKDSHTATTQLQNTAEQLRTHSTGLLSANNFDATRAQNLSPQQWLFDFRVDFIHRTVGDFLRTAKMQHLLKTWSAESFNADLEICTACLATLRITPSTHDMFRDAAGALSSMHIFLSHAKLLETPSVQDIQEPLIDDFLAVLRTHEHEVDDIKWMILGPGSYWAYQSSFNLTILYHLASYDLGTYVLAKLASARHSFSEPREALLAGTLSLDPRVRTGKAAFNLDTILLFLRRGFSPNLPWGDRGFSFWQQLLNTSYSKYLKGVMTPLDFEAVRAAIEHGADLRAKVEVFNRKDARAVDIVEKILSKEQLFALKLGR